MSRIQKIFRISNIIFYLIILFLPTQLGKHFWPHWSSVLGIRIDYLAPTLYLTDVLIILLFIFVVLEQFMNLKSEKRKAKSEKQKFKSQKLWILFAFTTCLIIGIVQSKNPQVGIYGLVKIFEMVFFGWYVAKNLGRTVYLKTILLLYSASILFQSILSCLQFINQSSINGLFYFLGERTFTIFTPGIARASIEGTLLLRPYGTFSHPNVLAGFLLLGMFLVSSTLIFRTYKYTHKEKLFCIFALLLGSCSLVLTLSRVGLVLWGVIIVGFIIYRTGTFSRHSGKRQRIRNPFSRFWTSQNDGRFLTIVFLILFAVMMILLVRFSLPRFSEFSLSEESVQRRVELNYASIEMFKNNPILGVGVNNFLVVLPHYFKESKNIFYIQPVHNIYLLILAETGILGFLFFLFFLFKTAKHALGLPRALGVLCLVLIIGFFDHYLLTLQQGQFLLAFVFGLCWARQDVK